MSAVPRSGCFSMSTAGTRVMASGTRRPTEPVAVLPPLGVAVEPARQRERDRELRELGRLEVHRPEA